MSYKRKRSESPADATSKYVNECVVFLHINHPVHDTFENTFSMYTDLYKTIRFYIL